MPSMLPFFKFCAGREDSRGATASRGSESIRNPQSAIRNRSSGLPSVLLPAALAVLLGLALPLQAQSPKVFIGTEVPIGVERIYARGLQYLVQSQNENGSFQGGQYGSEAATPALAMLAMFAHGDDPNYGPYAKSIKRCLDFLLQNSDAQTGYIGRSMYNHGFSTLALAEAYGAVQDERIGPALRKAVELILTSQEKNHFKAWRYSPDAQDADSTVSGACFVALIAARNAGLRVPDNAIEGALKFYTDCQSPGNGSIGYMPSAGSQRLGDHGHRRVAAYAYARKKDQPTFTKALKAARGRGCRGHRKLSLSTTSTTPRRPSFRAT